jgi:hypothetical protein
MVCFEDDMLKTTTIHASAAKIRRVHDKRKQTTETQFTKDNNTLLFINDGPNKVSNSLSRVFCSQALYESAHEDPSCNQSVRLYTIHPCRLRGAGGSIGTDGTPMRLIAISLLMAFPIRAVLAAKHLARRKPLRWSESDAINRIC